MKFLEKDLEQIIFEADRNELEKKGLDIQGVLFRQLQLGPYGIADLVTFERSREDWFYDKELGRKIKINQTPHIITIYELKKDNISVSAFFQAVNYARGVQRYFENKGRHDFYKINIVLIGKTLDLTSSVSFLPEVFSEDYDERVNCSISNVSLITYDYGINGLIFKNHFSYKNGNDNSEPFTLKYKNKKFV